MPSVTAATTWVCPAVVRQARVGAPRPYLDDAVVVVPEVLVDRPGVRTLEEAAEGDVVVGGDAAERDAVGWRRHGGERLGEAVEATGR